MQIRLLVLINKTPENDYHSNTIMLDINVHMLNIGLLVNLTYKYRWFVSYLSSQTTGESGLYSQVLSPQSNPGASQVADRGMTFS